MVRVFWIVVGGLVVFGLFFLCDGVWLYLCSVVVVEVMEVRVRVCLVFKGCRVLVLWLKKDKIGV